MGLLDIALGKANPIASYVDANKFAIHGAFSGLGSGQNISQGLANAAAGANTGAQQDSAYGITMADQKSRLDQILRENTLQDNALKLQAQGANATADWLERSPNPQVRALAGPVRNRVMTGADAIALVNKPGQTVQPGDSVLANQFAYGTPSDGSTAPADPNAGSGTNNAPPAPVFSPAAPAGAPGAVTASGTPPQPTQTAGQANLIQAGYTPSLSASGPNTDTSSFYGDVNGAAPATPSQPGAPAGGAASSQPAGKLGLPANPSQGQIVTAADGKNYQFVEGANGGPSWGWERTTQQSPGPSFAADRTSPSPATATSVLPGSQDGSGRLSFVPATTAAPTATPAAPSAPVVGTGGLNMAPGTPQVVFHAQTGDPLKMTVDERKKLAADNGIKPGDPGYANLVLTGKMPQNVTEVWRTATAADKQAAGISPSDPQVYQVSSLNQFRAVPGAISQGSDAGPPLGTTGKAEIDPTVPGYTTKTVIAGLTQGAIDQRAIDYLTSGTEPPVGRTGLAGAQSSAIANRMAEIAPSGNLAANKAQLASLSGSLAKQQEYLDTTQRSVSNAEAGFAQVTDAFKGKVNPSQYPTINAMVNAARLRLLPGDISAYNSGLQEVANEYSQVFSRGGQVSDAVRAKSASIVNGDLSIADLGKVLKELQSQGDIVVKGSQTQVKRITSQINGIISGKGAPDTTSAPTKTIGGVTYTQNANGDWTY